MTVISEIKKEENLDKLQELFLNVLEELEIFGGEKLESLSRQLRKVTEDWHTSLEPKIPIKEKDIEFLEDIVTTNFELVGEKSFEEDVINAYLLDKPGSSIEIHNKDPRSIKKFIDNLRNFFFVDFVINTSENNEYCWIIYISRLKRLNEMAVAYHHKYNGIHNFYADFIGLFSGYTAKQAWNYCQNEDLPNLKDLII